MIGAVFKDEGTAPLVNYPKKGIYSLRDMHRTARQHGIPFAMPDKFPILTVNAARIAYWVGIVIRLNAVACPWLSIRPSLKIISISVTRTCWLVCVKMLVWIGSNVLR